MPTATPTAPTNPKAPATAEEGYALVQQLIYHQVNKFQRRYGGDREELEGEAHIAFMKGHNYYTKGTRLDGTPLKHDYATEIRRWVWFELFDKMRVRLRRQQSAPMVHLGDVEPACRVDSGPSRLVFELGDDARMVAELVLNPPAEVDRVYQAKGGTPRNFRSTVRTYLKVCGWDTARINDAFEEIMEALG